MSLTLRQCIRYLEFYTHEISSPNPLYSYTNLRIIN